MCYKASWCLYIGDNESPALEPKVLNEDSEPDFYEYTPYNFSGKSFSQNHDEKSSLNKIRKWNKKLLANHYFLDYESLDTLESLRKAVNEEGHYA